MSVDVTEVPTLTPMMQQWQECKEQAKEAILFFRLGDFYEAFYEDASVASQVLDLTLTKRHEVPMCGIPYHTSESYIERLVAKGFRVAIAEQVEDPKKAKGLVARKLVYVASPATHVSALAQEKSHSFFASISYVEGRFGLAMIDLATATFQVFETDNPKELTSELFRHEPKELLISKRFAAKFKDLLAEVCLAHKLSISTHEEWLFDPVTCKELLQKQFQVATLDGFGLKDMRASITSAGALLQYLTDWLLAPIDHLRHITLRNTSEHLLLDRATLVNLEIVEPIDKNNPTNSLLSLLDETKTAMGARLLRQWLKSPLVDTRAIMLRQDAVEELITHPDEHLNRALSQVRDLERQIYRIKTKSAGPREYVALRLSCEELPKIKQSLKRCSSIRLKALYEQIDPLEECSSAIRRALVDTPPFRASDGALFREGYNEALDELKALRANSQEWLQGYQASLREETGIKTLKVGYTRMFGYYIEISRGQVDKVPANLERKQTLVNAERYISRELKEYEEKVLSADEKILDLEERLFTELREEVAKWHAKILETAQALAQVDCLHSLALVAKKRNYTRPQIDSSRDLFIREGRHPVIESLPTCAHFIHNDLSLDGESRALMCLTGPNMAGKSTFIRQIALLVIMAQMGSFIPAKEARIGIVDKVFSRIGASDDLARGQSTFMVEMAETASILNLATERSLVILDEIGRGTSTYDGISIAWAVAEYLVKNPALRPKTLFATHYSELTALEKVHPGVVNFTVAISETAQGIVFLRKIIPGMTDKSYGIHVAKLAGMPSQVIERAEKHLLELEKTKPAKQVQGTLFSFTPENPTERKVLKELIHIDLHTISPLDCMIKMSEWQKLIKNSIDIQEKL